MFGGPIVLCERRRRGPATGNVLDDECLGAVAYGQGTANPPTCAVGQVYFNTSAPAGQNLYLCATGNTWSQIPGAVTSIFGRTGAVTAQTGDYTYAQIANTPTALPPNGTASGDLSGAYPDPVVSQVNGAAIPSAGLLKANGNRQLIAATAGADYMATTTAVQASQMPALSGDCITAQGAVSTTCTKTNGVAFAASATTDATNAGNLNSGTLNAARLPATAMQTNQTNVVSGGTQDFHAAAHTLPMVTGPSANLPSTCTVGEIYFATNVTSGQNQFYCTGTNSWTQQTGAVATVFGRAGAVTAQTGDYTYAQIANTPTALPPTGAASGDLTGTYPSPKVSQVNGAAVPTSGLLKANTSGQLVSAVSGADYQAPLTNPLPERPPPARWLSSPAEVRSAARRPAISSTYSRAAVGRSIWARTELVIPAPAGAAAGM